MSAFDKAPEIIKKFKIDECEVVFVKKKISTIRITDSDIVEIKEIFDEGYGIRLIYQKKILSVQSSNESEIEKIIEKTIKSSSRIKAKNFWKSLPSNESYSSIDGTYDEKLDDISCSKATDIAQTMINSASDDKINSISGSLNIVSENFEISNSNGVNLGNKATFISGMVNAQSNSTIQVSGFGQGCCRTLDKFSPNKIGEDAKTMCIESINPKKTESDIFSIIFEPYSVGELLAFVVVANFNLKIFAEKKSCFSNNFQNNVAVEEFNLTDDPHMPEGIGTKPFDDEGTTTKKINYIENGIFKNTYSNLFDSFKENKESTAHAVRPGSPMGRSSEPIPISSPHNLKIESGNTSQEEMIKDTKHGLLVGRLWYTYAVNPIKGDFSCTARSGIRIIENGEIKNPGKPVRIIHNLPVLLQNISAIGNNQKNVLQWASIPSITPSIKVEKIKTIAI